MSNLQWVYTLTVCSCNVTYAFPSESTLYSCLNVKELLARSRCKIWSISDCNLTWTQNQLVCKWTLNHLAKLAKWLSVSLRTKWFWVRVQLQELTWFSKKWFFVWSSLSTWYHLHLMVVKITWSNCNSMFCSYLGHSSAYTIFQTKKHIFYKYQCDF